MMRKIHEIPNGYELNTEKSFWSIARPEEAINILPDPSFEAAVITDYFSESIAGVHFTDPGVTAGVAFGSKAIKSDVRYGLPLRYRVLYSLFDQGNDYTWSFYEYAPAEAGVIYQIKVIAVSGGGGTQTELASKTFTPSGNIDRQYISFNLPIIAGLSKVWFDIYALGAIEKPITVDGYMLEKAGYLSTYIDGDQPGCEWLGAPNASGSRRLPGGTGGRIYEFKNDLGFAISAYTGHTMPPFELQTTDLAGGGAFTNQITRKSRALALVGALEADTIEELQADKEKLAEVLGPDLAGGNVNYLYLIYQLMNDLVPAGRPLGIKVLFAGGLSGSTENRQQEKLALQFIEDDPLGFFDFFASSASVDAEDKSLAAGIAFSRSAAGQYSKLAAIYTGAGGPVVEAPYNVLAVVSVNGVSNRISTFSPEGAELRYSADFSGLIHALASVPKSSEVLAGGAFGTGLARYNLNTAVVTTLFATSAAINGPVRALYIDLLGQTWVGGEFTNLGSAAGVNGSRLAVLNKDQTAGYSIGASGPVRAIVPAGRFDYKSAWIGGDYTTIGPGATAANRLAKVSITPGTFAVTSITPAPAGGLNGPVYALCPLSDGSLLIGGTFTTAGGLAIPYLCKLTGNIYSPVGKALNGAVKTISVDSAGLVYLTGDFTATADGSTNLSSKAALFDGNNIIPLDVDTSATSAVITRIVPTTNGRRIYTLSANAAPLVPFINTIVNTGSAAAWPKFQITVETSASQNGLYSLYNITTGARIDFDNYLMLNGEIVTVDCTPNGVSITSNYFGDIRAKTLPGSSLGSFYLAPGPNKIALIGSGFTGPSSATWHNYYLGVEGGAE